MRERAPRPLRHLVIGGQQVAAVSKRDLLDLMLRDAPAIRARPEIRPRLVFSSNGQSLSLNATDSAYRQAMDQADIVHADGMAVVFASRLFSRTPIPDRSSTTDLFLEGPLEASRRGVTYYLLGGSEAVNAACARRLTEIAPRLRIVGRHHGYFADEDADRIIADINAAAPDVLWLGLGKPKEQIFAVKHADALHVGWIVTCGGAFNYATGGYRRAPRWMQNLGLEWLHRLAQNPRKLFWRYAVTNPHALWLILKHWLRGSGKAIDFGAEDLEASKNRAR